jgi:hypothetical protein
LENTASGKIAKAAPQPEKLQTSKQLHRKPPSTNGANQIPQIMQDRIALDGAMTSH